MEGEVQTSESVSVSEAPVTQTQDQTQSTETQQDNELQTNERPPGFDKVEFTPEQQERVNRLYGNMKRYETKAQEQERINQILIDRFSELQQGQQQIVTHLQTSDYQDAEARIAEERDEAWQAGDVKRFNAANDKLIEIKTEKKLSEREAKQKPKENQQVKPQSAISATDAVNLAVEKGDISSQEANIYRSWANETDDSGNLKRPWINEADMRNSSAAYEGRAVFSNPSFSNKSFAEKLREVDRRMGVQSQTNAGNNSVLGSGNLTRTVKNNTVKLTPAEEQIALKTKFGGSKAKSDVDHLEAYRQAKIKSQAKKGSR